MPEKPTSYRLKPRTKAWIERLAGRLDESQSDVVEEAVRHFAATLERGLPVFREYPGETQSGPPREGA